MAEAQTSAMAATASRGVVLRQIFQDRGRAIAEGGEASAQEYIATFSDRSQCALKVVERKETLVSLDISACAKRAELQVQTLLEPSLFFGDTKGIVPSSVDPLLMPPSAVAAKPAEALIPAAETAQTQATAEDTTERPRISIGLGLSLSPTIRFDEVRQPGYAGSVGVEVETSNGVAVSADVRYLRKNSWGFLGGVSYEPKRDIKSLKVSSGNVSISSSVSTVEGFSDWLFEGNAAYRWEGWYLPFGINYSYFQYTSEPGYTGGWELSGGLGLQLGVGYYLNRNLAIELWSRATTLNFKLINSGVTTLDFGRGVYSSGFLSIRGVF